ncbi:MAG: hypothetical protein F4Z87_07280 [Gammaproteobacteria bacterium]|nr:hypothetical protein [Gammaproteobacteria bacterium]
MLRDHVELPLRRVALVGGILAMVVPCEDIDVSVAPSPTDEPLFVLVPVSGAGRGVEPRGTSSDGSPRLSGRGLLDLETTLGLGMLEVPGVPRSHAPPAGVGQGDTHDGLDVICPMDVSHDRTFERSRSLCVNLQEDGEQMHVPSLPGGEIPVPGRGAGPCVINQRKTAGTPPIRSEDGSGATRPSLAGTSSCCIQRVTRRGWPLADHAPKMGRHLAVVKGFCETSENNPPSEGRSIW